MLSTKSIVEKILIRIPQRWQELEIPSIIQLSVHIYCINAFYTLWLMIDVYPAGTTSGDTDECSEGTHDCHTDATCTNTDGSFECNCNTGYSGDGSKCTGMHEICMSTKLELYNHTVWSHLRWIVNTS